MNEYSEHTKKELRELFYEHMPKFPFPVTIKPLSTLGVANRRQILKICQNIRQDLFLLTDKSLIRNLSEDYYHENLCPFEQEIVNSEGFNTLLFMMDINIKLFEHTIKMYTCEYLRQEEIITNSNADSFGEIVFLPHITTRDETSFHSYKNYGKYTSEADFILNSHQHKIVVLRQHRNHLTIPLPKLMTYDFKDYDVREAFRPDPGAFKVRLTEDFKDASLLIQMLGLQNVILPPYVYEADSIS